MNKGRFMTTGLFRCVTISFNYTILLCSLSLGYAKYAYATEYAVTVPVTGNNNLANAAEFDKKIISIMQYGQIPGATVAIIKNNQLVVQRGYGHADIEANAIMQPNQIMRVGSVSKAITAIAIFQLVQQGKLKLDDKVFTILSDLKVAPKHAAALNQITVRNLLQMSAGWFHDRPQDYDPLTGPWSNQMLLALHHQIPPDCATVAKLMAQTPIDFKPGTLYTYSNVNYCLLGLIFNKITHSAGSAGYESAIQQKLLAPLAIQSMHIGYTQEAKKFPNEVKYYFFGPEDMSHYIDRKLDGLPYSDTDLLHKNYADGGWVASATDLAKLFHAVAVGTILNQQTLQLLMTPYTFSNTANKVHGLGFDEIKTVDGQRFFFKTGSFSGTQALIVMSDNGNAYAALFNAKPKDHKHFVGELKKLFVSAQ